MNQPMLILGEGTEKDKLSLPLYTKRRNWIPNVQKPPRSPAAMEAAAKIHIESFGSKIRVRSLSGDYNCYGMVFGSRRTVITRSEDIESVLRDDGYRKVANRAEVCVGDVIIYRLKPDSEITHVGFVVQITHNIEAGQLLFRVLSQWGFDGEYIHPEDVVPTLFGTHRDYYSERIGPKLSE